MAPGGTSHEIRRHTAPRGLRTAYLGAEREPSGHPWRALWLRRKLPSAAALDLQPEAAAVRLTGLVQQHTARRPPDAPQARIFRRCTFAAARRCGRSSIAFSGLGLR